MLVAVLVITSCANTSENMAESQEQINQETPSMSDAIVEGQQEAIEEAIIETEEMEMEADEEGEVKPQTPQKEIPKSTKTNATKTNATKTKVESTSKVEIEKPAPKTSTAVAKTETSSKPKATTKPITKKNDKAKPARVTKAKTSTKPSHDVFNSLLSKYVTSSGTVSYSGFKGQKSILEKYLGDLAENPVENSWSKNEKMAYWINLYNASTIMLILDNYPTSSIKNINGGKPWDKRWIKSGSKTYTLNEIENSILRSQFKDARIHFAVNCAAISCPRLMNKAFTASNLNSLLDENARWFINNSTFNDISSKKVQISKIFDWYAADFGNIVDYLNKYTTTEIKSNAKVSYKEYDWKLNGK